jgi:hypothetical protein
VSGAATSKITTRTLTDISTEIITENTTITSAQRASELALVSDNFANHLLVFSSGNVSAIISQYEPSASVTWEHFACLSGIYPISGNNGSFTDGLDTFFNKVQGLDAVFIGNVSGVTTTSLPNGSLRVNSTFGLRGQGPVGNFTATVSAQDTYTYSASSGTWLISQETWNFMSPGIRNVFFCA